MDSLTIKLPTHLKDSIAKLAAADGRSVSDFVRRHFASTLTVEKPRKQKGGAK
jgi:hypothetical protein